MLTDTNVQELLAYQAQHPVLSIYLNIDPTAGNLDTHKQELRGMLKKVDLPDDVEAVERYFQHEFDGSGRSVAVFSCAPEKYFKAFSLSVPIRSRVRVSTNPYVKPLADLLDYYGGYGVVLVDKQGARLFYFHLGQLMEQEGTMGEEVRHSKHGSATSAHGRRGGASTIQPNPEEIVDRNLREAASFATAFFAEKNARRVLIGGTDDNVSQFRSQLPKAWQSLIVGTFPMSMTASKDEVMERAMQVGRQAELKREKMLVKSIKTSAAKGKGGVIQLEDTLGAVHEGRVQTLLIRDGYRAPGYQCKGCGYVTSQLTSACPFCGKSFSEIPDAVEMAVHQVMKLGGEVEVVHDDVMTEEIGNIGALLRY
jgi:hypothetical protein